MDFVKEKVKMNGVTVEKSGDRERDLDDSLW